PEAAEQGEQARERNEAFEQAVEAGTAGKALTITTSPATGWVGEQVVNPTFDDWEPAVAAEPTTGPGGPADAYLLPTRYAAPPGCSGNCPNPYIALYTSTNGGVNWSAGSPLCACKGSGQFDPIIEVVPGTGAVYALYMNGYNVMFIKSVDHGQTW